MLISWEWSQAKPRCARAWPCPASPKAKTCADVSISAIFAELHFDQVSRIAVSWVYPLAYSPLSGEQIAGTIGTGLFLGSGGALSSAGPLGALIAYMLVGTVAYSWVDEILSSNLLMLLEGHYARSGRWQHGLLCQELSLTLVSVIYSTSCELMPTFCSCPLGWSCFWFCSWLGKQSASSGKIFTHQGLQNYFYTQAYVCRPCVNVHDWTVCHQGLDTRGNISRRGPVKLLGHQCTFLTSPWFSRDNAISSSSMYRHTLSWVPISFQ